MIAIINLLEELKGQGFGIHAGTPSFKCKTFEDKKAVLRSQQITKLILEQNMYQCACIISIPILYEKYFPSNMSQPLKCLQTASITTPNSQV